MRFRIALTTLALLVFALHGVAGARPAYCPYHQEGFCRGTLVFTHALPAETLGPVEVYLKPHGITENQYSLGVVAPGETLQVDLRETDPTRGNYYDGAHELALWDHVTRTHTGLGVHFQIVPGGTTTVTAQLNAEGEPELVVSVQPPPPETASPRPQTVTVPTRVETGGGGAADGAGALVLGGLATATVASLLMLGVRPPLRLRLPTHPRRRSSLSGHPGSGDRTAGRGPRHHETDCRAGARPREAAT